MNVASKVATVLVLGGLVAAAVLLKQPREGPADPSVVTAPEEPPPPVAAAALPRLVDLGATTCIPCKLMAPILDQLTEDFAGQLSVEFIDINDHPEAKEEYGVLLIPTQVFFDAEGQELFRHEGFFSREDILAKWQELGVELTEPSPTG